MEEREDSPGPASPLSPPALAAPAARHPVPKSLRSGVWTFLPGLWELRPCLLCPVGTPDARTGERGGPP